MSARRLPAAPSVHAAPLGPHDMPRHMQSFAAVDSGTPFMKPYVPMM